MKAKRPQKENADRATRAAVVLKVYTPGEGAETGLRDLLADALHLIGQSRVNRAMIAALSHYREEANT